MHTEKACSVSHKHSKNATSFCMCTCKLILNTVHIIMHVYNYTHMLI